MGEPLKKIESKNRKVWITQPDETKALLKRREIAFNVAKGKLIDSNGNIETVMQTAEAFGRGLFADYIKKDSDEWTMDAWVRPMVENVFNPMGTGATFTKINDDEAKSLVFRCPLHADSGEPSMASLFTYGYLRGMLVSAFPGGELLMGSSIAHGAPMIEFTFKADATSKDRMERERIKKLFTNVSENLMKQND